MRRPNVRQDSMSSARDGFRLGVGVGHNEMGPGMARGDVFIRLTDGATGAVLEERQLKNIITLDASLLVAMLLRAPASRPLGLNMLAVGTGATGALLSPDAPDNKQRKLNAEIQRKPFASTTFRDALGNAVAYPTNVCDFTTSFSEAEAVGPLNEMSLLATVSANPSIHSDNPDTFPVRDTTVDVSDFDIAVNYLPFPVISKPSTAILTITWRLTY